MAISYSLLAISLSAKSVAQDYFNQWYIKDFQSEINVNADSSLNITENITADCPQCTGKHGIFRTLPSFYTTDNNTKIKIPIGLISITDFNGKPYQYQTQKNNFGKTLTLPKLNIESSPLEL